MTDLFDDTPTRDSRAPDIVWGAILRWSLVGAVLVVAGLLRFTGLNWDMAQWIHPDEGHMRTVTGAIHLPDSLSSYFDTHTSPLNPLNNGQVYSYGTLPLFATRALAEWLEQGCAQPAGPEAAPWALNARLATLFLRSVGRPVDVPCPAGIFTWTYSAFLGRHLSALADLGTVLLIYLLGRRLYGETAGLIAMALASVTVLMIQQAHFFTVDSAATLFTTLTAYLAVRAAQARHPPWIDLGLAGLSTGLATASKISAAVAAGLVALGAAAWVLRHTAAAGPPAEGDGQPEGGAGGIWRRAWAAILAIALPVLLSGLLAFVAFRVAQPYAFEGPGFFGVRPSPEWFARLKQIGEEQSGLLDYPSGRQWTDRLPVVFPWVNIVFWGMGLPLGLAAWVGWALMGVELARGRLEHLVLWPWTTAYFVFYATRWVKALRYFLPIYPLLILMASYALVRLVRRRSGETAGRQTSGSPRGQSARVMAWAAVFLVVGGTAAWGAGFFTVYLRPNTRIAASRWIYANVPVDSVVANEHWDWGLPLRVDARGGVTDGYIGITMALYDEDTPEKRDELLAWLDETDYIFLASNRLYASIPRLPERYPLTIEYYRSLFAGELGFELVGEFTSYPTIGPFAFPDQETPFRLMAPETSTQGKLIDVPLPKAEESFSVYDHPNCLIFKKTASYSPALAASILDQVDLSQVKVGQSPQAATPPAIVAAHDVLFYLGLLLTAAVTLFAIRRAVA